MCVCVWIPFRQPLLEGAKDNSITTQPPRAMGSRSHNSAKRARLPHSGCTFGRTEQVWKLQLYETNNGKL